MKVGDKTGFKDRKGNEILIGDKLKLGSNQGTVFYNGIISVKIDSQDFMKAQTVVSITTALEHYKGVKIKEKKK